MKTKVLNFQEILEESKKEYEDMIDSGALDIPEDMQKDMTEEDYFSPETIAKRDGFIQSRQAAEMFISEFGQEQTITIRKLGFGKIHSITDQATNIKVVGRKQTADPEYGKAKILTVLAGLVEAPFDITREFIDEELDPNLGEFLFKEIDKLSSLSPKKKNDLIKFGEEQEKTET
ncbi:hypothetical protein KAR91_44530 [Candidatus Pacearchaeota archaeon]|nr:hypothetical protein [Candidatus Pacearchaeota archaeon]